jgi:isopentenyl diphosphate isomerase/L-lactate dehydrogenase-like FMN-dependent dehydrogenase
VLGSPLLQAQSIDDPERFPPLAEILNATELERAARHALAPRLFDHIAGGAESERTLRRNREFFERITFRPRMLVDVTTLDLTSQLFGREHFAPILAGPTALQGRVHAEGEAATARGCIASNAAMVLSERSSRPVDEIAQALNGRGWRQLSPSSDLGALRSAGQQAESAGFSAIVLTVDASPRPPLDRDVHNAFDSGQASAERPSGLEALAALKQAVALPLIVKGILSPDEASSAIASGADGLCVSNHGGRAGDGLPATIEALPRVAEAVDGRVPVLVDGGFRRGSDILKGLALGASAVMLGRPVLWALAAYGAEGVQRLLELLQSELALAMGLSGTRNLAAISEKLVKRHRW